MWDKQSWWLILVRGNKSNPLNTLVVAWLQKCTPDYLKLSEVSTVPTFSNRKWTSFLLDSQLCTVSPDLAGCRRLSCARAPLLRGDRLDLELIVQLAIRALAKRLAHLDYADAAGA